MLNLSGLTKALSSLAEPIHKYAALAMALLAGLGITPGTAQDQHLTAIVGAAYAALVHGFDAIAAKTTPPAS